MKKKKNKKNEVDFNFDYVQGWTRAWFSYVLTNDSITDQEFITVSTCEVLDMFNGQENFFAAFLELAIKDGIVKAKHLDKLYLSFVAVMPDSEDTAYLKDLLQGIHDEIGK